MLPDTPALPPLEILDITARRGYGGGMNPRRTLSVLAVLLVALAAPVFAQTPCDASGEPLDAIQTRHQIKRFVLCALGHVDAVGWNQAVQDFQTGSDWLDGSMYLFAGGIDGAVRFVAGSSIAPGTDLSNEQDSNGHYFVRDIMRVAGDYGEGYVYYRYLNRNSGEEEPKVSYVMALEVEGEQVYLGAGTYPLGAPGACPADRVRAESVATERGVEQFVHCAAEHLRRAGLVAVTEFETDPRWLSGPTYLFLIDLETMVTISNAGDPGLRGEFRGHTVQVREMQRILRDYGEGYVYYDRRNPATDAIEPKASFVRRVSVDGYDYILGAGLYRGH